ncbi:MAG: acetyl-CoA carboxylase, biotin carboxyl carrier protein [Candidatus Melainabacteria bacterium RIFCSPHIGHO2_02_FULL_34_12]|nr:MAG: acetyl-CoA carboxylase, biotin carboxyl carrier protein [Candidatus Melainabacteria bacterium RIFCSPHIGHO2_02_FULL_34_12]
MKIPWDEIEQLTKYIQEKGLTEITIETKEEKITVKKDIHGEVTSSVLSQGEKVQKKEVTLNKETKRSNLYEVTSPMVGTFYGSSSPGAEPFVQVGSKVKPGDVLCIIEAMKIMNELPSEVSGTIKEIIVHDNQTVEFGHILMRIEP